MSRQTGLGDMQVVQLTCIINLLCTTNRKNNTRISFTNCMSQNPNFNLTVSLSNILKDFKDDNHAARIK